MHFVFFGLSLSSSWGNGHATTYRGLLGGLRRRGHDIDFFERDAEWYANHRDLPQPTQARLHLYGEWARIRDAALTRARGADAVIVGSYFPDAIPLLDDLLNQSRVPVCFYDIDTPITLEQIQRQRCTYLRRDHIPAVDLYLSFTGGPVLCELEHRWGARRPRPLYCCCDEREYRTARRRKPSVDLSFLGTYAPDRQAKFQRLMIEPARRLRHRQFHVAGSMFPDTDNWPSNIGRDFHLPPARHPSFYASSRFTLNLTRQAMVEAGYSPSVRLFEAAAAATAVITDPWPGLTEFFQPGIEILVAEDTATLVQILQCTSAEKAARIGHAARARALRSHTSLHRAMQLESYLGELRRQVLTRSVKSS